MEFNGAKEVRILDDKVFEEFRGIIEQKKPKTVQEEIEKIQKVKKKQDDVKRPDEEEHKISVKAYYYVLPSKSRNEYNYYFYALGGVTILKVPQSVLGPNVLGTANLKTNIIQILETLSGCAFEEVKRHELNHIKYPYLSEWDIREMTRAQLYFYPIFH